ncbi:hypothetical protein [Marinobacterium jannaschii]|uniref:hypothetical protein n=1 Tax=Marinobacterium jannaschii TaxID=64970 RepID=UPI000A62F15B|nr:hypothetical protein [Marinobacterium jannaschii]
MKQFLLLGVSVLLLGMDAHALVEIPSAQVQSGYPDNPGYAAEKVIPPFSRLSTLPDPALHLAGRIGFSIHIPIHGYHGGSISLHSYPGYGHRYYRGYGHGYYRYKPHRSYRAYKPHRYRPHIYQPFYYRPHHQRPHHYRPYRFRHHGHDQGYSGRQHSYGDGYHRAERRYRNHEGYRSQGQRRRHWQ